MMRIIALVLSVVIAGCQTVDAQAPAIDPAWSEDLTAFRDNLEARHIDLYHTVHRETFQAELDQLAKNGVRLSEPERLIAVMRLTRTIGDGHKSVPLWGAPIKRYPIETTLVDDAILITGVSDAHKDLLGGVLKTINGAPADEAAARLSEIVPFVENAYSERVRTGMYLTIEDLLVGFGVVEPGGADFTIETDTGVQTVSMTAVDRDAFDAAVTHRLDPRHPDLYFERPPDQSDTLWFGAHTQSKTIYIQFDAYPAFDDMARFAERALAHINETAVAHIIIDLRDNFGGDFFTGLQLSAYLNLADSVHWRDGVYVLIGNRTFSAAMSNAAQFKQTLNAKLVGEPTGARPCGYQDMGQFNLPNSSLLITYSKRRFCFIDTSENAVSPDILIKTPIADYVAEQDSVLDWVMADIDMRAAQ
ncbi:MAG: hypothetical protein AAF719_03140 [Pseudomonadota bacterium]